MDTVDESFGAADACDILDGKEADSNGDGEVGVLDFLELLANWGPCA